LWKSRTWPVSETPWKILWWWGMNVLADAELAASTVSDAITTARTGARPERADVKLTTGTT
jgi:hypothetical protein